MAIRTWACSDTRAIFQGYGSRLVPGSVLRRAHKKLLVLNAATGSRSYVEIAKGNSAYA